MAFFGGTAYKGNLTCKKDENNNIEAFGAEICGKERIKDGTAFGVFSIEMKVSYDIEKKGGCYVGR